MNIYIAVSDPLTASSAKSWIVGAFSSEERAQAACQEDASIPSLPLEMERRRSRRHRRDQLRRNTGRADVAI